MKTQPAPFRFSQFTRVALPLWLAVMAPLAPLAQPAAPTGSSNLAGVEGIEDGHPPVIRTRLVAEHGTVSAGQTLQLAWQFELEPHWHIYWRNPGDSGLPPSLHAPASLTGSTEALAMGYPAPKVIPIPPLTNYGYENRVTFPVTAKLRDDLNSGTQDYVFKADFLYCKDVCLPGTVSLTLPLTVAATPLINPAFPALSPLPAARTDLRATREGNNFLLALPAELTTAPARFLPDEDGILDDSAPQTLRNGVLIIPADTQALTQPERLRGLLLDANGVAHELDVPLEVIPPKASSAENPFAHAALPAASVLSFLPALAFAFLAGLILNLMPCVLPVLSLKLLGLIRHHHGPERARHVLAYTLGILVCFAAFAALVGLLQAGGTQLGWGFHLQQPWVVASLTLLMVALALNFFGVFELGHSLTRLGGPSGGKASVGGSFGTGALAVIVATPCTVPFMGGAMAYALTQPFPATLAVFLALGVGMALPFLLTLPFPALLRWLPKPGAWMVTFKQALGWPMLLTALWLAYVYQSLTGQLAAFALLGTALLLALGLWLYGRKPGLGSALMLAAFAASGMTGLHLLQRPMESTAAQWQPWSESAVAAARAEGRPVFMDFTADWCITCKVTEATVLNTAAVQALFASHNTALFKADWTRQDPAITAELAKHGRKGVPLYLLYLPGADEAEVLPQLLTYGLLAEKLP